ncbi:MAG: SIS domain-containing protein [Luteitalea sp.]|nr:SIS domain-containing protein [Luteitalea sp.]
MPHTGRQHAASERPRTQPTERAPDGAAVDLETQVAPFAELLARPVEAQRATGYYHTLREIGQQPDTWRRTAAGMLQRRDVLKRFLEGACPEGSRRPVLVTGSGSSYYGAECLSWSLQDALSRPVLAVSGGQLLTDGLRHLPVGRPTLMMSLGRSGNSPESSAAIDLLLEREPTCRHLIITCNRQGHVAQRYHDDPRVLAVVLDDETCDRSLVMTSSLTNMLVAARFVGLLDARDAYTALVRDLTASATRLLVQQADALARVARHGFRSAVFLGSGPGYGAAREAALKLLEMTAGDIPTMAETYLALRHGPMSAVRESTVMVCFLSSDPVARAYETDLIREVNGKALPLFKVVVGQQVPDDIILDQDLVIDVPGDRASSGDNLPVLDILVGQLLAFFCSLHRGFAPDRPSTNGAIARVVAAFDIHQHG